MLLPQVRVCAHFVSQTFGLLAFVALSLLLTADRSWSGDGEIVDGKLSLSVMFAYDESDPESWRPVFEEASSLLFNATNGQIQLGRVRVLNCGFDQSAVDVWVLPDNSGAFATLLGLGGSGHIFISQTHKSTGGDALGQFGIVHEIGHYALGLFDEYKGESSSAPLAGNSPEHTPEQSPGEARAPNQFCVTEDDATGCLMDGGTTVPINNARTEFCTHAGGVLSTAHNAGAVVGGLLYENAQEVLNHESCWETIERLAGLTAPSAVETANPPGLEPVEWEVAASSNRVVLCVDRSGSMSGRRDKIALAQRAASGVVDLLHAEKLLTGGGTELEIFGDEIGVVSFAADTRVDFAMREVLETSTKDSVQAAIGGIRAYYTGGGSTDVGKALERALQEIEAQSVEASCSESIILLSDGAHNLGTDPSSVVPSLLARGVKVYTVGFGNDADVESLMGLAEDTGGRFFFAATRGDLPGIVSSISAEIRSGGLVFDDEGLLVGLPESYRFLVDGFAEEVTAVLEFEGGTADMTLTSPTGDLIDVESAETREDVEAVRREGFLYIRVIDPEVGEWVADIIPVDTELTIGYAVEVTSEARAVDVVVTTNKQVYRFQDPLRLRAEVTAGVPVAGAEVTATISVPGAEDQFIELFDDGAAVHGDAWANDGVYNTVLLTGPPAGVYTFDIRVENIDGSGPDPDLPFVEDGADPPVLVAPFVRFARVQVLVEDVLGLVPGVAEAMPSTVTYAPDEVEWLTVVLELPEPYRVDDVDLSTVLLERSVALDSESSLIGDQDGNGVADLAARFSRDAVLDVMPLGIGQPIEITGGTVGGARFIATATLSVLDPSPEDEIVLPGSDVATGTVVEVDWGEVDGVGVDYTGFLSVDGGLRWTQVFGELSNPEVSWLVANAPAEDAILVVEARGVDGVIRQVRSHPFSIEATSSVPELPMETRFLGALPNPASGQATLSFTLAREQVVDLEIFDVAGRVVRSFSGLRSAGRHDTVWDGRDGNGRALSSGVYLYRFRTVEHSVSGRLTLLR